MCDTCHEVPFSWRWYYPHADNPECKNTSMCDPCYLRLNCSQCFPDSSSTALVHTLECKRKCPQPCLKCAIIVCQCIYMKEHKH